LNRTIIFFWTDHGEKYAIIENIFLAKKMVENGIYQKEKFILKLRAFPKKIS